MSQAFREALYAKLGSIASLNSVVGPRIFPEALPATYDVDRDGPALTYMIATYPRNHVLTGSDGTATARVQLSAWSISVNSSDQICLSLFNALDGLYNDSSWGDGTVVIMSCLHQDEVDLPEEPKTGKDEWIRQVASEYEIKHRVAIPTHI